MIILGIETSCDETAVALIKISKGNLKILSNLVSSQIKLHAPFGGVVPKIAGREHLKKIIPLLAKAFQKSKIKPKDIDLIAVTGGPGLAPSLFIGTNVAKALSYVWEKPIVRVNHVEAHILINWFRPINEKFQIPNYKFQTNSKFLPLSFGLRRVGKTQNSKQILPAIGLIVSGGHTQLVLIKDFLKYKLLGETLDDAAGECFDKTARILGLGYPGGPAIAEFARQWKSQISCFLGRQVNPKFQTNPKFQITDFKQIQNLSASRQDSKFQINLPRPMINSKDFNFSFSGLKTAVLYDFKKRSIKERKSKKYLQEMCWGIQQAVIDVLIFKTIKAAKKYQTKTIILGGGVAANKELRKQFNFQLLAFNPQLKFLVPPKIFCTDNAVMIALSGFYYFNAGKINHWMNLKIKPDLTLKNL